MPKAARRSKKSDTTKKATAVIKLTVYAGTRKLLRAKTYYCASVDGRQEERVSRYIDTSSLTISVPFSDNFIDNYTVLVTSDGQRDAGFFPIKVSPFVDSQVDLMLVPRKAGYAFQFWAELKNKYPRYASFFCCAGDEQEVQKRYADLTESQPAVLASLLNTTPQCQPSICLATHHWTISNGLNGVNLWLRIGSSVLRIKNSCNR